MDPESTTQRFLALYTGAVTDILDELGYTEQTLPSELAPLQDGMRLAGPVYPVVGKPRANHDYDTSIRKVLEMLGSVPAGHVAVYKTDATTAAHLGELSVTSLIARGCVGAVIDGGCRDIDHILQTGWPVFARYTTPVDCIPRWELLGHGDVTIEIGGVRIKRGDYLFADRDGVIVVPSEVCAEVLERAEGLARTENDIRRSVRDGMHPLEAYEQYGAF